MKSEAELDSQLAGLHYRIEHESISLNEEKKAMATIKKLEQQRERVRCGQRGASTVEHMAAQMAAASSDQHGRRHGRQHGKERGAGEKCIMRHDMVGCHVPAAASPAMHQPLHSRCPLAPFVCLPCSAGA